MQMKTNYNPKYSKKHISIRVPWHDNKWDGTVCKSVKNNNACLILKNCAESRDDKTEDLAKFILDAKLQAGEDLVIQRRPENNYKVVKFKKSK